MEILFLQEPRNDEEGINGRTKKNIFVPVFLFEFS